MGQTPMVKLRKLPPRTRAEIYCKLESFNPMHSVKDRIALAMIEEAERSGRLRPGMCVIEPTSGNTGIGLAMVCAVKGYRLILTMPESMSSERKRLLRALGAELVLTPAEEGMQGAIKRAHELCQSERNAFMPMQFENPANPGAHLATAEEIIRELPELDMFVAGIGTGGTISGVGRRLKQHRKDVMVIGVEPAKSPVISEGKAGFHGIQGIGAGFIPRVLDLDVIDKILTVTDEQAKEAARQLALREGILAGISSGAALHAAFEMARDVTCAKKIVVLLPDSGERYLSTDLFQE
ncbi:MAG: cysteine synthase A [Methanomassiliicoccales archaeon]